MISSALGSSAFVIILGFFLLTGCTVTNCTRYYLDQSCIELTNTRAVIIPQEFTANHALALMDMNVFLAGVSIYVPYNGEHIVLSFQSYAANSSILSYCDGTPHS